MVEMTGYQRQYSIQRWANGSFRFEHESILEDFIWDNLNILFKANPLRRQHHVNGNYCDILAIGKRGNLIIIELKNDEDRYVVQQITRYYHRLIQEKPYPDRIDYQQPIELLIVSPYFHDDNLTDRLYHKLEIDFIQFQLANIDDEIVFKTNHTGQRDSIEIKVPHHIPESLHAEAVIQIPPVPRSLNTALARCPDINPDLVLIAREKILKFDSRIQEIKLSPGDFLYGKGKSKPCAQITVKKQIFGGKPEHQLNFGLWLPVSIESSLPLNSRVSRIIVSGIGIENNADFLNFSLHQKGRGRKQQTSNTWFGRMYFWHFLRKALCTSVDLHNLEPSIKQYCDLKEYQDPTHGSLEYLDFFVSVALDLWKERLESLESKVK